MKREYGALSFLWGSQAPVAVDPALEEMGTWKEDVLYG